MMVLAVAFAAMAGWLLADRPDAGARALAVGGRSGPVPAGVTRRIIGVASRWLTRLRAWRSRRDAADSLIELCTGFAAELRAGRPPIVALRLAAGTLP
ncbi:MAG: type II secretion system protein, partial [Streptosporangiales bacterium]|nr:type II secretion system protein [Streptosporangiales bacterium]